MPVTRKRKFGSMSSARARKQGLFRSGVRRVLRTSLYNRWPVGGQVTKRVRRLESMIETKENSWRVANVSLPHNNTVMLLNSLGTPFNIFQNNQGAADPMTENNGNRVGDKISVKGVMIRAFFECALERPKVYFRVMLLKGAKGETFNRDTIFKGDSGNKMLDQVNTERFSIVASKTFNVSCSNQAPTTLTVLPPTGVVTAGTAAGIGTRTFKMWIPGRKFGKFGNIIYENASTTQVKFYDYRLVVVAYDWYGTPQDLNTVGKVNELYSKCYFKDA